VKLKKGILISIIIVLLLVILTYMKNWAINKYRSGYDEVNNDTKEKIAAIIKGSKGEIPNLQTESCNASWIEKAHNKQKELMDKVLDSLTVVAESRKKEPKKYIIATFYDNMQLYIPYDEQNPYKKIIIKVDSHYYIAAANRDDITAVIDYMKNQGMLR